MCWVCDLQQIIKPFSGRVAQIGQPVAGCSPSVGTVSAASISPASDSKGPGPSAFEAPDSDTCCSSVLPSCLATRKILREQP